VEIVKAYGYITHTNYNRCIVRLRFVNLLKIHVGKGWWEFVFTRRLLAEVNMKTRCSYNSFYLQTTFCTVTTISTIAFTQEGVTPRSATAAKVGQE